jgi:hypothetical protein
MHSRDIARAIGAYARHLTEVQCHRAAMLRAQEARDSNFPLLAGSRALDEHRAGVVVQRSALRESVCALARALRVERVAPELALKQLKETLRSGIRSVPRDTPFVDPEALVQEAVGWAIDAYYDAA